jgi:hypothetical protein
MILVRRVIFETCVEQLGDGEGATGDGDGATGDGEITGTGVTPLAPDDALVMGVVEDEPLAGVEPPGRLSALLMGTELKFTPEQDTMIGKLNNNRYRINLSHLQLIEQKTTRPSWPKVDQS